MDHRLSPSWAKSFLSCSFPTHPFHIGLVEHCVLFDRFLSQCSQPLILQCKSLLKATNIISFSSLPSSKFLHKLYGMWGRQRRDIYSYTVQAQLLVLKTLIWLSRWLRRHLGLAVRRSPWRHIAFRQHCRSSPFIFITRSAVTAHTEYF